MSDFVVQKEILKKIQHMLKHRWKTRLIATEFLMWSRNHKTSATYVKPASEHYNNPSLDIHPKNATTTAHYHFEYQRLGFISVDNGHITIMSDDYLDVALSWAQIALEDPECFNKVFEVADKMWDENECRRSFTTEISK